jgi:general secretion pathway protein I
VGLQGSVQIRAVDAPHGLTLVEVLVAMAITAISVMAALQLIQATATGLRESKLRSLALLCLDNEIVRLQIDTARQASLPFAETCSQDGMQFRIELRMLATPHPNFRRIEAQAYAAKAAKEGTGLAPAHQQAGPEREALLAQRVYFQSVGF